MIVLKRNIFTWCPVDGNTAFKLVKVNEKTVEEALDHDDINIILKDNKGIVEIYNRKKKKYEDHVIDLYDVVIWTDVLEKLHEVLGIDWEKVMHVFPVRIGVFETNLHYEIVKYSKPSWYVTFIDGTKVCIDGIDFVEKGYKIGIRENIKDNIKKLLTSDKISNYKISKETGIAQTTLSDYATGKSKIGNMKLDHALKLNEFYKKYKDVVEMLEVKDWQEELSRPYSLWILHNKWFCVDEVVIDKNVFEDNSVVYTVKTTDYREIAKVNDGYITALSKLETYYDDGAAHDYEEVERFDTLDEAITFINKEYPAIDIETELKNCYENEEDEN